ncbi:MAG TPA: hypothetical protein ENK19_07430, partial [Acidobacteria bacterium]|nr:hypothetical protein [Acidobacteriota bacterium]
MGRPSPPGRDPRVHRRAHRRRGLHVHRREATHRRTRTARRGGRDGIRRHREASGVRRVEVQGHIAKKGNRYYVVIYEGIDPATGKGRHRWHAAGSTRKGAERLLAELVKRHHDGEYRPPEKITLGEYLERWLPTQKARLSASTYSSYQRNVRLHVLPYIGSIPLQRLTPEDLDGLYARLLVEGRRNKGGGELSPKTVRLVHAVIHKALADAQRKGSVIRNVAGLADPPKLSARARPKMKVWEAHELRRFLELVEDHPLYTAFYVKANPGMRR